MTTIDRPVRNLRDPHPSNGQGPTGGSTLELLAIPLARLVAALVPYTLTIAAGVLIAAGVTARFGGWAGLVAAGVSLLILELRVDTTNRTG